MRRPVKLEQILFSQGFGTRRSCSALILSAAVQVDGLTCTDPQAEFAPEHVDRDWLFQVNDVSWTYRKRALLMLHKPAGYECSQKAKSHPAVYTLLPDPLRTRAVQAVGRLDQDCTGLLLFSDDGQFIHRMTSPRHEVPKLYEVRTSDPITDEQITRLLAGVVLEDDPQPVRALACVRGGDHLLAMTLTSGKYHQVKRMLAAVGNHVAALHRSQIGRLRLPADLGVGQWRWLSAQDEALLTGTAQHPND